MNEDDDYKWGRLNWSTHQARYIIDTMNMRSTKAPAATPYTHIFSFPSVEEEARQFVCLFTLQHGTNTH